MLRLNTKRVIEISFYGWFLFYRRYFLLWSFHIWYDVTTICLLQFNCLYFSCIVRVKLVKILLFRLFCLERIVKNLQECLLWTEIIKLLVEVVALQSPSKIHLDTNRAAVVEHCSKCPSFSTKPGDDLNYQIAKNHSAAGPKHNHTCKECSFESPSFYSLRHHKQCYHTAETTSSAKKSKMQSRPADARDDKNLEEEIQSCRHFLVESEIQKWRLSVFNFVVNTRTAQVIDENLDRVLDKLKCAAKLNLALGFFLKLSKTGNSATFMLTRTTPCWNSQNLRVTKTTWQYWKRFWRKRMWLSHALNKGPIGRRSEGFLN